MIAASLEGAGADIEDAHQETTEPANVKSKTEKAQTKTARSKASAAKSKARKPNTKTRMVLILSLAGWTPARTNRLPWPQLKSLDQVSKKVEKVPINRPFFVS
ncbi:MAG: hypothetical protein LC775_16195 [Acidobacteria bacterium]|nr:hypothetical protein [Acidobacteriota bacterium]